VPSLSSLPGRTFVELCALRMSSADFYPHSLFSLSHCVLTYPHALQLVQEEQLQVRIPTITIVCVCQFMFSTISPLSPPPRTALNVFVTPQSRFHFVFVLLFENSHRLVLVRGVAGAGGAGVGGSDNEGKGSICSWFR
jgi:hypothetical protein